MVFGPFVNIENDGTDSAKVELCIDDGDSYVLSLTVTDMHGVTDMDDIATVSYTHLRAHET